MSLAPARLRAALSLAAAALAAAALAAPASAQETAVDLGTPTGDVQGTHFAVPATCSETDAGQSACAFDVVLTSQRTVPNRWDPQGPATTLAQTSVTIPAGTTQTIAVDVPAAKLRDPLLKAHGAAIVTIDLREGSTDLGSTGVFVFPPRLRCGPGGDGYASVTSGSLLEGEPQAGTSKLDWQPLAASSIAPYTSYRVTSESAAVRFGGVTWTLAKGSGFSITCTGLSDFFNGRSFPAIFLDDGKVRATGTPHGALLAATVVTQEGNLGMRRAERTDMTITRSSRRWVTTMRVAAGRSGQITTFFKGVHNGQRNSPCTFGHALSVNRYGIIKKL